MAASFTLDRNPFRDQQYFMQASEQSLEYHKKQLEMYLNLVEEEFNELDMARSFNDHTEQLDALVDIIVVAIGAIISMGVDPQRAWNEVIATNIAKIDPKTGKVRKRADGKVLKPEGWQPPDLSKFTTHLTEDK